ncbi:MobA/MobL family protein [Veillonella criceti]|uniref:DNA strand transferase n=2 Tax=Veillonella criceti TaxID=103891 RepID=A0A380Q2K1_9FIRM|nr:MobA/MobL family protein [Veillonella criceti]SUP79487.1 DNA strand transferase [Veillonella criceti]
MAIYRCSLKVATPGSGRASFDYISREGKYKNVHGKEDCIYTETQNLPTWANDNGRKFWREEEKKMDGYRKIELALPNELSNEENVQLVQEFCQERFGDNYVYSFAVHDTDGSLSEERNIHCHIMFSERKIDKNREEPTRENYFKKSRTRKDGSISGGYKKDENICGSNRKQWLIDTRQIWENQINKRLEEKELPLVTSKSLEEQGLDRVPIDVSREDVQLYLRTKKASEDMELYLAVKASGGLTQSDIDKEKNAISFEERSIRKKQEILILTEYPKLIDRYVNRNFYEVQANEKELVELFTKRLTEGLSNEEKKRQTELEERNTLLNATAQYKPISLDGIDLVKEYYRADKQLAEEKQLLESFNSSDGNIERQKEISLAYYSYARGSYKQLGEDHFNRVKALASSKERQELENLLDIGRRVYQRQSKNRTRI